MKLLPPTSVGVPLITPAPESVMPCGSVPEARLHAYCGSPPCALSASDALVFQLTLGKVVVVIATALAVASRLNVCVAPRLAFWKVPPPVVSSRTARTM